MASTRVVHATRALGGCLYEAPQIVPWCDVQLHGSYLLIYILTYILTYLGTEGSLEKKKVAQFGGYGGG